MIAHSGDFGIEMDNGSGNRFSANSIHDNGAEGIHLAGGGANNDQASPALTTATFAGSTTTIAGTLASAASTTTSSSTSRRPRVPGSRRVRRTSAPRR